MAEQAARIKQIKIQTGVVKRLGKEKQYYKKEITKEEDRLAKMQCEADCDEYKLKQQRAVINESKAMIPDTTSKLNKACSELSKLLDESKDLEEQEEVKVAKQQLQEGCNIAAEDD